MAAGIIDRKLFFIINPQAGGGNARDWWARTQPALDKLQLDYFFAFSEQQGSAAEQVRQAITEQGAKAVVAVGGDGTLFEAINGMIQDDALLGEDVVFVACPAGSACDFGRFLYGRGGENLLEMLQYGKIMPIDIGRCLYQAPGGGESVSYYINSFDAGAGADTCKLVNNGMSWLKRLFRSGRMPFLLTSLKVLMTYRYSDVVVELAGESISGQYILIGLGNGAFAGGGMMLFPKARLDDGLLDLLLIGKRSRLNILRSFAQAYDGSVTKVKDVVYCQVAGARIKSAQPLAIELDGEVPGSTEVAVSVLPGLLPLLLPDQRRV